MKSTRIDWCDATINPAIGCKRGCPYCYARRLNTRFGWIKDFTRPVFFQKRLEAFKSYARKSIFVNSMSDFEYWDKETQTRVALAAEENHQHNYIFLTKSNFIFNVWGGKTRSGRQYVFNGKTITLQEDIDECDCYAFDFLSIEPILEPLNITELLTASKIKQVIIGAETGNRKGKVIPDIDWVLDVVKQCDTHGAAVFMKESLRQIMGAGFRQDPLIWAVNRASGGGDNGSN